MADSEIAGILVRMEADLKGLKADFAAGQKIVGDASSKMAKAVEDFGDRSGKSMLDFGRIADTTLGVTLGNLATQAIGQMMDLGKAMFQALVVEGVGAAQEAEAGLQRFSQALQLSGLTSEEAKNRLVAFANQIQATTIYEGDAVISSMALMQSLGQLSEEGLKQGTQAALDLATALGIDLNAATLLVGKAAAGEVSSFSRYGMVIEKGATQAETFSNVLNAINARMGGSAAAATQTYAGATEQLKNQYGDLTEEIGNAVVQNSAVIAAGREAANVFKDWGSSIAANKSTLNDLVGGGLVALVDVLAGVTVALDAVATVGKITWNAMAGAIDFVAAQAALLVQGPLYLIYKTMGLISDEADQMAEKIGQGIGETQAMWTENADAIDQAIAGPSESADAMLTALARVRGAAESALNTTTDASEGVKRSMAGAAVLSADAAEAAKKAAEEFKKLGDEGAKIAQGYATADPNTKYELELEALRAANEQKKISNTELDAAILASAEARDIALQEQEEQKLQALIERNAILRDSNDSANQAEIDENQKKSDAIINQEGQLSTRVLRIKSDQQKKEAELERQKLAASAQIMGNLASIIQGHSWEAFEAAKALTMAETIIKGVLAVQTALASAPPPFNFALAATQGAMAAANVAKIAGTRPAPGFQHGIDHVPGIGTADNFPAVLAPGERVVPAQTNKDLTRYLENGNEVPSLLKAMIARLDKLEHHVVVNIEGRHVMDVLNDQLARGRRLAI